MCNLSPDPTRPDPNIFTSGLAALSVYVSPQSRQRSRARISDWGDTMTSPAAARIAAAISLLRPEWSQYSLATLVEEFRGREPRDVALALVWLAHDPTTRTPGRLREDGPWWHLGERTPERPGLPTITSGPPKPPLPPGTVAGIRHRAGHHADRPRTDCPHCPKETNP